MTLSTFARTIALGTFMWMGIAAQAATVVPQKSFIYRVKITTVTDKESFGTVFHQLENLFDNNIRFNDTTDEIIIHSDSDVSKEKLSTELVNMGYTLQGYRQAFIPVRNY